MTKLAQSNTWPVKEALALLHRLNNKLPEKGYVLFETGYGPSGLPHIGTFGEVVRTSMVRFAFEQISGGMPTKLFCISDDMDGMRKIPDTIPNKEEYVKYLNLPLSAIPDPFGTHPNYAANMNNRLCKFLDSFGFEYEFKSATECYKKGLLNEALLLVLKNYDKIMEIMLPTLGEERQQTYSPFLPISPKTGKVLAVSIIDKDVEKGTITFHDEDGTRTTIPVTDGHCKLQWKPDFGARWKAFGVDFEMYGKDHLVNGPIYSKICNALGGTPPHQMFYELFLDENGQKISKSKGNGISVEQWLKYATEESLSLFMFQAPQKAKRLYFDVIPKSMDEYLTFQRKFFENTEEEQYNNPLYYIHFGKVPEARNSGITYSLLLNLVSACNTEDVAVIEGYIKKFVPDADLSPNGQLDSMVKKAMNYYEDFVLPNKKYRLPNEMECKALLRLLTLLKEIPKDSNADMLQNIVYQVGKEFQIELKEWFCGLYEVLLGSSSGPRFGTFIALFGIEQTIALIENILNKQ